MAIIKCDVLCRPGCKQCKEDSRCKNKNCGGRGHIARHCPKATLQCMRCGGNHLKKDCLKPVRSSTTISAFFPVKKVGKTQGPEDEEKWIEVKRTQRPKKFKPVQRKPRTRRSRKSRNRAKKELILLSERTQTSSGTYLAHANGTWIAGNRTSAIGLKKGPQTKKKVFEDVEKKAHVPANLEEVIAMSVQVEAETKVETAALSQGEAATKVEVTEQFSFFNSSDLDLPSMTFEPEPEEPRGPSVDVAEIQASVRKFDDILRIRRNSQESQAESSECASQCSLSTSEASSDTSAMTLGTTPAHQKLQQWQFASMNGLAPSAAPFVPQQQYGHALPAASFVNGYHQQEHHQMYTPPVQQIQMGVQMPYYAVQQPQWHQQQWW